MVDAGRGEASLRNRRAWHALAVASVATLAAAQLFLFAPITLYAGNAAEFSAALPALLLKLLQPAVACVALAALCGTFLRELACKRLLVMLSAMTLLFWLQGNLMVWDYGQLDGRSIDWKQHEALGWIELLVWAGVALAAVRLPARSLKAWVVSALAITVASSTISIGTLVQERPHENDKRLDGNAAALEQLYRFSRSTNVLHVVADGLQTDIFNEILENGEEGRRLRSALDGFVVFEQHMGAFPFTHMSVPALLSGQLYRNHMPREEFLDQAVGPGAPSILNAAAAAGYEVDLAVLPSLLPVYARGAATNVFQLSANQHVTPDEFVRHESAFLFDLSLFRLAPHFVKRLVYADQRWLTQRVLGDSEYLGLQSFADNAFLRKVRLNMRADRDAPVYKLLHPMVSHMPMATDEECRYAGGVLKTVRSTVRMQARCGVLEIVGILERMKELGIYDSATIVIMGDHGAWVPPPGIQPRAAPDHTLRTMNPVTIAMAVPLFAIKPPRSPGPLRTSASPSWIVDTAPTIAAVAGIPGDFEGRNAFELQPREQRERSFHIYTYDRSEWHRDYLAPITEVLVNGPVLDSASWGDGHVLDPVRANIAASGDRRSR